MVKGLYTAYTGLLNQQQRLDVLTNNLANAATNGFKKEGATTQAFDSVYALKIKDASEGNLNRRIGSMNMGVKIGETYTDYGQGSFRITDNAYDFAVDGNGFFAISFTNKQGETSVKYTRDGSFTINQAGFLVTKDGDFVLDQNNNRIQLEPKEAMKVDTQGNIFQNEQQVAKLNLVEFENNDYLTKYGENMFDLEQGGQARAADGKIQQGCIETSNVQVVAEMVEMIAVTRAFETNQKAVQTVDTMIEKAVNTVGKL